MRAIRSSLPKSDSTRCTKYLVQKWGARRGRPRCRCSQCRTAPKETATQALQAVRERAAASSVSQPTRRYRRNLVDGEIQLFERGHVLHARRKDGNLADGNPASERRWPAWQEHT